MAKDKPKKLKIISIEEDAKVPDTFGLERFMEEVNILELEGVYFSPNRKLPTKKAPTLREINNQPVTLIPSVYGQPGELAYKVLQAIFLKLTEQGPETQGRVLFSRRELAGLVGKSFGGTQSDQLFHALMQLRHTGVACTVNIKEKQGEKWMKRPITLDFNILSTAVYEGSTRGQFARCLVEVHEVVLHNLRNRHISYFNWERMRGLDMVGMMLYKRFFRHMANIYREGMDKNRLSLERDYEAVSRYWLGLKPHTQLSRIQNQLGPRLRALEETRLLRDCHIERRSGGQGFKIVGHAGAGFFADYENIYLRRLPPSHTSPEGPEPLVYLNEFHTRLGHSQEEFAPKEVTYVRELLSRYGEEGVRDLMDFGLSEAQKTGFAAQMQWFGALSLCENKWQGERKKALKSKQTQDAIASCPVCNEYGYLEFCDGTISSFRCKHDPKWLSQMHSVKAIRRFHQA